ncbi:MAG: heparinase II/III family protein [Verrucomicrobia bacterium]|nr:heparinase II/III family protein [Verrucomicrobiota bacterium]
MPTTKHQSSTWFQKMVTGRFRKTLVSASVLAVAINLQAASTDPLLDWSAWETHRDTVKHPCVMFKPADIARARENINRYAWAKSYASGVEKSAKRYLSRITPEFLTQMVPDTTPGDALWTPCPACRAKGKPVHPHGLWSWSLDDSEHIKCNVCGTLFPNDQYPEDVVLQTRWRKPQTISYCGGDTFVIFGYKTGRPSFTANVRARKVKWISGYCRSLAEAHLLTGKPEYARACRDILVRLAECYPTWLVHVGYGEYADMDPRIASQFINKLPEPELCPPPNKPNRRLHTGYWSAGRAGGVGMESGFVRQVVEAYDFTCTARDADGKPVYTDGDRRKIERDLLLESSILLVCDKAINNKSVSNRTAAALVGMCVGHPELVWFGLEGFYQTVDGWFLPDGATSESPGYGTMTLGGIWDLAQAFRGYSDPPGYRDAAGKRIDSLDLYHGTAYERVWECFFRGLQGDLHYPPSADSLRGSGLGVNFIELMAGNYPDRPQYLALLKETLGVNSPKSASSAGDVARRELLKEMPGAGLALYYREPGLESKKTPTLSFPDWCPPELRIGHMRTGADGRESLLTLSASHWGNHHHQDSLNLYHWKQGREVLSDLGYLWDHPEKHMTVRTVAHNTVVIDEKEQITKERGGDVLFFKTSEHVKAMEASSRAYPDARLYRRTSALIDHGNGRSYVVDFFRVEGGKRQDYVYHGFTNTCDVLDASFQPAPSEKLHDFKNIRAADGKGVWRAVWKSNANMTCVAWNIGQPGERAFVADGWGQRDWKNTDIGATIPYIVRRCEGDGVKTFISVFEGHEGAEAFVRGVKLIDPAGVLVIETALGTDYVMSMPDSGTLTVRATKEKRITGHFAVAAVQNGKLAWTFVETTKATASAAAPAGAKAAR